MLLRLWRFRFPCAADIGLSSTYVLWWTIAIAVCAAHRLRCARAMDYRPRSNETDWRCIEEVKYRFCVDLTVVNAGLEN